MSGEATIFSLLSSLNKKIIVLCNNHAVCLSVFHFNSLTTRPVLVILGMAIMTLEGCFPIKTPVYFLPLVSFSLLSFKLEFVASEA